MHHEGIRRASVAAAVLAALLLAATAAHAAPPTYKLETTDLGGTKEITSEEDATFKLLTKTFNGSSLKMDCGKFKIDDGLLFVGGGSLGKFLIEECSTYINNTLNANCAPLNQPVTIPYKGNLILHTGRTYNLLVPDEPGTKFTAFKFDSEMCPSLQSEVKLTGSLVLEDGQNQFETEAEKHLMQQASTGLFTSDVLSFGSAPAVFDGSLWLRMAAPFFERNWSGVG
jgi:hypothetical protein